MKKSLSGRLARLEGKKAAEQQRTGIIVYDPHDEPSDPAEREAFFNGLRPAGMDGLVIYLPENGR